MNRLLVNLCTVSALAAAASAQCFEPNFGTLLGYGDDLLFGVQPMNISFPMGGVAPSYTDAHIGTNGVLFLTNGAVSGGSTYGYQTAPAILQGAVGASPCISPLWCDLESVAANGGGVFMNNTIPGKFVVTWSNTVEWATQAPVFTVQAQLFATGEVVFTYTGNTVVVQAAPTGAITGLSEGNAIAAVPGVNLSAGGHVGTSRIMFEQFVANTFDLGGTSVSFFPNAGGGYTETVTVCPTAFHENYGLGCYSISDSFYQLFADAATAAPALNGQSMVMMPVGNDYLVTWGGGTYVAPTPAATALFVGDDGEVGQAPSIPLPTPSGPVSTFFIGSNGIISSAQNPTAPDYTPDAPNFLNSPVTAFWSWHDYNSTETPVGGQIKYEEAVVGTDTIAYITWDAVENYPLAVVNPSTMQFQLNLTTGVVKMVWVSIDANTASPYGSAHLIGWSPGGPSSDQGSINLATALPYVTSAVNVAPLTLSAAPPPVSSGTLGTLVTYTTGNMREYAASTGIYIGMNILSLGQIPGGLDLSFLGAPGCRAYVGTLDFTQAMVGASPTNTVTFAVPPGLPAGTQVYSQSVCLITPNSLPNGQNAFGMIVSGGVRSYIAAF